MVKGQTGEQNRIEKTNKQRKSIQELFQTREDHALNINLCVKIVKPLIFTYTLS